MKPIASLGLGVLVVAGATAAAEPPCRCATSPDISGNWSMPWDAGKKSLVPAPEKPPAFTPEYQKKYEAIHAVREAATSPTGAGAATVDATLVQRATSCLPYGMPSMMEAGYSIEILQRPGEVVIVGEAMFEARRIYLDKKQLPLDDVDLGYEGHSVGHWEGDTLVVNTIGVKESVLGRNDMPHSEKMVIGERIRLTGPDALEDQITITDPIALARPYKFKYSLTRRKDYETPEFVCDNPREHIDASGKVHMELKN